MDAAKKAALEKWLIFGFGGVLLIVLANGPLKYQVMGLLGRQAPAAVVAAATPAVEQPSAASLVGTTAPRQTETAQARPGPSAAAPIYTASDLRDPMKSLLPEPSQAVAAQPAHTMPMAKATPAQPAVAPPAVKIQGVVWGGPQPQVIINNRIYGLNDFIDKNTRIIAIERPGITIAYGGQTQFIPVPSALGPGTKDAFSQQAQWR